MGYDMSIKGTITANDPEEVEQAKQAYQSAAEAHRARMDTDRAAGTFTWDRHAESEKEFNELYGKYSALAYPGEFRLNIFGMGRYREAMADLGMAYDSRCPVASVDWDTLPDSDADYEVYQMALDRLTSQHGESSNPTIPLHKFGSNDGWVVTPDEIRAALEAWDGDSADLSAETDELIQTDYWNKWIAYLRLAADHEGFRVY